MAKNKPLTRPCINITTNKVSHLVITRKKKDIPPIVDLANPKAGDLVSVTVCDEDNNIEFEATPVAQGTSKRRLALRLVAPNRLVPTAAGDDPTEALISVTLNVALSVTGTTINETTPLPAADVPVDYIVDPDAPSPPPTTPVPPIA